uniref:Helicase ATP-binding domain-containing protein n=1 Tax=Hucho hucho TaxID=62062 RepID=A0A4W5LSI1_9TELE
QDRAGQRNRVGQSHADTAGGVHHQQGSAQAARLQALASFQPQLPSTLQAQLRDYQQEGYEWMSRLAHWGVGACLADDMGLGKTVQTLALLLERAPHGPQLVVAPTSVALNWLSETARFAPTLKVRPYHQFRSLAGLGAMDVVVVSYGLLQQDADAFAAIHWQSVVLDEAQAIKNAGTKRAQAVMDLNAEFRLAASGTPVENHLGELWSLFRFLNPGLLGSQERFAQRFGNPIERGDKGAKKALKTLIQPFILRRTKTQVLDELPPRTEITRKVPLSSDELHLYEAMRQQAVTKLDELKKFRELITQLKTEDAHFTRLFDKHNELDQQIKNMEAQIVSASQTEIETLKKEKLKLKDELYVILKSAAVV